MPAAAAHIVFGALAVVCCILAFYYLYFFSRLAFYKSKDETPVHPLPCSIIVCARNEAGNLKKNLPLVFKQQIKDANEVIVVNDQSTDETTALLKALIADNDNLQVLETTNVVLRKTPGKKYPLSVGIEAAKFDYLLLTDADCKPASINWASKMLEGYTKGIEIILGYGAYKKLPGFLNKIIRFETFHTAIQYLSYALAGQTYMGVGRNLSYKKEVFQKNNGFASIDHVAGGDDDLFINKAANGNNVAIMIYADAHTISEPKTTWADWKRQKTRHYSTAKYYKPFHKILLGAYSLSQFLFYPLTIAALFLYNWKWVLAFVIGKSVVQFLIFAKAMKKLNEPDLIKWIFVMDAWMFFYYAFFASTLYKKEKKEW